MIKIDDRLRTIADMVRGDTVADIGSDHAYLPIWLCREKKIKKAYAIDISEKCVAKIKKNIQKHDIPENVIIPVLSDGFSRFESGFDFCGLSDIIIAGMGGESIAKIIEKTKTLYDINGINFVFQPNSKIVFLQNFLSENNFDTKICVVIESKKRFYTVINAKYAGET